MHVKTKDIALTGMIMALSVLCIVLGGVFEFSTLTLLLVAAFLSGTVICDMGLLMGAMCITGTFLLGFFLGTQKMYVFTYLGFSAYIFLVELFYRKQKKLMGKNNEKTSKYKNVITWIYKFFIFNIIFIPCLIFMPEVFLGVNPTRGMIIVAAVAGQLAWIVLDIAYNTFILKIWKLFKKRILHIYN